MIITRAAIHDILDELAAAQEAFPPFHSAHEGYAVLLEEVEELWAEVVKKTRHRNPEKMRYEAVQVAAMALRFIEDVCGGGRT